MGVPNNRWFRRENPIKMDDLGVPPFMETFISLLYQMLGFRSAGPLFIVGYPAAQAEAAGCRGSIAEVRTETLSDAGTAPQCCCLAC